METILEVPVGDRRQIQTVGAVIRQWSFIVFLLISIFSSTILLVISIGSHWPVICQKLSITLYGIIGALYTLVIACNSLTISWILVDDCTWFFKAITLLISGALLLGCGCYYFYLFFWIDSCHEPNRHSKLPQTDDHNIICALTSKVSNMDFNVWTPGLMAFFIITGVIIVLFSIYLLASLDQQ